MDFLTIKRYDIIDVIAFVFSMGFISIYGLSYLWIILTFIISAIAVGLKTIIDKDKDKNKFKDIK